MTQTSAVQRPDVPVFVVGIDNESGEGLTDQLGRHPRLSRVPRTRLLGDLDAMLARNQVGLVHYGMPEQYWRKAAAGFHSELQREHASRNGKARWVEFIPSSTLTITQVDRLFPTAQFVHVIARPRGGAGRRRSINRRTGAGLFAGRYLEIFDRDARSHPEESLDRVLDFLGEARFGTETDLSIGEAHTVVDLARPRAPTPLPVAAP